MKRWLAWPARIAGTICFVLAVVVLLRAFDARKRGEMRPWHTVAPRSEAREADLGPGATLADYLHREEAVFREVQEKVVSRVPPADRILTNRYWDGSPLSSRRRSVDWNRTIELTPTALRGGVLLLHGLTDAPYSMRALAEIYRSEGFYALVLRIPGHGTVPGGLTRASWRDWAAAVRMGMRHVRGKVGAGLPVHLAGYSNGGALAVHYALETLEDASLPRPDRLLLLSPMIGVTPFAGFARWLGLLAVFPVFEQTRWLDVMPEYVPFKYNSFPANAGAQTSALTSVIEAKLKRAAERGRLGGLPPTLTFAPLFDATVLTPATAHVLYDRLPPNGSELVLFDLNRFSALGPFLKHGSDGLLAEILARPSRPYAFSVVTNARPDVLDVVERRFPAGVAPAVDHPLGLAWPRDVFSLSHVAIPFPATDPLFGGQPDEREDYGLRLGLVGPRGEKSVLSVPIEQLMRLTWNPFFPYMEARVREWVRQGRDPGEPSR
jgi:alpha-beta hydrolase superfamily lysophospholipase